MRKLSQIVAPVATAMAETIISGFPLAPSLPGRVGLLRGYGNAIVPQTAAAFVQAVMEAIEPTEAAS